MISSLLYGFALIMYAAYATIFTRGRRFYADEVLWSGSWGALMLLNGLFGQPYIQSALTNSVILIYVATFLLGHTVSPRNQNSAVKARRVHESFARGKPRKFAGIFVLVVVGSALGMIAPYEMVRHAGFSAAGFLNADSYGDIAASVNGDFRTGLLEQTLVGKVAFAIPQALMVLVGIALAIGEYGKCKRLILIVLAAAPLILFTVVSTIRSPIFIAVLLFGTSWLAGRVFLGSERSVFRFSLVLRGCVVLVSLGFMMFFFQSVRLGDAHFNNSGRTLEHLRLWVAGYVPALNGWLWNVWDGRLTYGSQCFRFVAGMLRGSTAYLQTVQSNIYVGAGRAGNACTMFRPAINDFGMVGCAVFMFAWGAISRTLLSKTREGSLTATVLYACNLAAIVWSPNAWYFSYGSRVLSPVLAIACVWLMTRVRLFPPSKRELLEWRCTGSQRMKF